MKLKNKTNKKGMTLIEITLVIAILLGLIAILFIGITAYKKGSDKAKCVLNISTVQKVVLSYANLEALNIGEGVDEAELIGPEKFMQQLPQCPTDNSDYAKLGTVPSNTEQYLECTGAEAVAHNEEYLESIGQGAP